VTLGLDFPSVLVAARTGAEWAWTRLYRDLAPSILRYFRCYSADDAEDLLGEVFLQLVRDLPGFSGGEDQFRAWVFTIARRRLVDTWRRQGRRREDLSSDHPRFASTGFEEIEEDVLKRLSGQRVRSVLARLTPAQRDVLFLRIIAGLSISETAEVLGNTPGGVKSLQVRGLEAIRRVLPEEAVS
jgi:RNA polymerase sigma-70 factor (ECF subfamily)